MFSGSHNKIKISKKGVIVTTKVEKSYDLKKKIKIYHLYTHNF